MPTLKEIKLLDGYNSALKKRNENFCKRKASPLNVSAFLGQCMQSNSFGLPGPSTKQDQHMLRGMINLYRNNGVSDQAIYDFVRDVVDSWYELRKMEHVTLKGKKWVLGVRPSIRDICICRESLAANLVLINNLEEHEIDEYENKEEEKTLTQEEIDAEFARLFPDG